MSYFSLIVIGLEIAFAMFFFTGAWLLADVALVIMGDFLAFNLAGAHYWGTSEIWNYSLYASLMASVLFVPYLGLVEFPVLFIPRELLLVTVIRLSVLYATAKDPLAYSERSTIWKG